MPEPLRGRKRLDDRRVLNGIVWKFRTATAWRDVPERYGPWATLHTRFRRWAIDGTFHRMLRAAKAKADEAGDIEWLVSLDSTIVRDPPACGRGSKRGLRDPALGRSRDGLTSKIHLACDGRGRPLAFVVTGGNINARAGRPGPQPTPARQPRWPATGLRPHRLQAPQRRGTVHQPPEAVAGHRYPLREDRRILRSSRHPCITPDVGVTAPP